MSDIPDDATKVSRPVSQDYGSLQPGATIGRYEIVSVLGHGGFGITYRARDRQLERDVAIKEYLPSSLAVRHEGSTVLPRSTQMADDFIWGRARFLDEAKTMARFANAPAIVRVHDFLEANGTAYVVMPLLDGETLESRLKRETRLQQPAIERIIYPLLDGLEQVHAAGFLHRDIKPANIILAADGSPTLIDFGAARASMQGRTQAMTAVFTPGYAPLEQFTSGKQGPWTDIYALAATLYVCINGKPPPNAMDRIVGQPVIPAVEVGKRKYAPSLLAAIDAGLAVKADSRPQSIDEWREILATGVSSRASELTSAVDPDATRLIAPGPPAVTPAAVAAEAAMATPPVAVSPRRSMGLRLAIASAVLALAGGGAYFALSRHEAPQSPAEIAANLRRAAIEAEKKAAELEALAKQEADNRRKLEEQRVASEAAARARAEDEARRKADLDALTRKQAEERAKIEQDRIEATARETAEAETRLKELDRARQAAEAERAKAQEAREKAEADAKAAIAAIEAQRAQDEEARRKAEDERAKALAAEKQRDEQAKAEQQRIQQEQDAKKKAADEEKAKAEAAVKPAEDAKRIAERDETALRLGDKDRQKIQVALTSLGFNTGGSDGSLGPRSRQMIAVWQQKAGAPATGFVSAMQRDELLRSAAPAIARWEEEQKKVEEQKKLDDERKKADEAKAAAAAPATPAPAVAAPAAVVPAPGRARWVGQFKCVAWGGAIALNVPVVDGHGSRTAKNGQGNQTVSVTVTGSQYSGNLEWRTGSGKTLSGAFSGAASGSSIRSQTIVRADQKGGSGPNEDYCNLELDRVAN